MISVLFFIFVFIAIPVLLLIRSSEKNSRMKMLEKRLQELESIQKNTSSSLPQNTPSSSGDLSGVPLPPPSVTPQEENVSVSPVSSSQNSTSDVYLENILGGNWFTKIGIVTLLFGIAFLFNYAYKNDWFGPWGWVSMGIVLSVILMGLGEWFVHSYRNYANTLTGGGLAILFLSLWAMGPVFYGLVGQSVSFFLLIIATALGFVLALRYDAMILMIMAITGGFLTPFLARGGFGDHLFLFGYLAFLNIGILAISIFKHWKKLNIVGLIGTVLVFFTWYSFKYTQSEMALTELFAIIFFIIFSLSTIVYLLFTKTKADGEDLFLVFTVPFLYYIFTYNLLAPIEHSYSGIVAVGVAIWYLFLSLFAYTNNRDDKPLLYSFLALVLTFFNIWILIVLDGSIITSIFLLEAASLVFVSFQLKSEEKTSYNMRAAGLVFALLGIIHLLAFDTKIANLREHIIIFNTVFLNYIIAAATLVFIGIMYNLNKNVIQQSEILISKISFIGANLLLFFILNYEVANYWQKEKLLLQTTLGGHYDYNKFVGIDNALNVSYSVLWMLYALISLVIGIATKASGMRILALGLFSGTILKIFLFDMNALTGGYRILSFISLGIILIFTGFLYQKYKDKIANFVKE